MPIRVTCPSCHTRFQVGDQHAGKMGACPKCKGAIEVPKLEEEVVIHAPELEAGAVDSQGRSVLKPIARKETKFQVNIMLVISGLVCLSVAIAWLVGQSDLGQQKFWVLAGGAILLGPPLAYAGYTFLRDDEFAAFEGMNLVLRSVACGLVYALLWGVYVFIAGQLFGTENLANGQLGMVHITGLGAFIAAIGGGTALVCFDFEYLTGFFHFCLYLGATILLRLIMDLPLMPGMPLMSGI
jgi:hypothetical protein